MRRDYTLVTFRSVSRTTADDERVRPPKEKVGTGKSKGFALAAHQAWGKSRWWTSLRFDVQEQKTLVGLKGLITRQSPTYGCAAVILQKTDGAMRQGFCRSILEDRAFDEPTEFLRVT